MTLKGYNALWYVNRAVMCDSFVAKR